VVTAAVANTLMLQAFDLYNVPAFSAFVRSFTRIGPARSSSSARSRECCGQP
jgi:hypothetical protein